MLDLSDLCATFRERSVWTHDTIAKGVFHGLGVMEETLTDMHLITVADKHPAHVRTKKFTRREEGSKSGADWLWVIGEPGSWLPLLIQAKIINPSTGNSQYLNHKGGDQRRKLLGYARRHRLLPLYTLYASVTQEAHSLATRDYPLREWGCSFVTPKDVRVLVQQGKKNINDLLPAAFPWPAVFCNASREAAGPAGAAIAAGMAKTLGEGLTRMMALEVPQTAGPSRTRRSWEDPEPEAFVVGEIPSIVESLAKGRYRAEDIPLSGVSVISTVPIDQLERDQYLLPLERIETPDALDSWSNHRGVLPD